MDDLNNDELWDSPVESESSQSYGDPDDYAGYNPEDDSIYDTDDNLDDFSKNDDQKDQKDQKEESESIDYLSRLLRTKGVDRNKVRIENDNGEIEEWKFDDLDEETKFGILNTEEELPLTDDEINTVNFLRDQDMTLPQFIEYQKQQAIQEYLEQNQPREYEVDKVSDDELFKFDLLDQMPDLTDEEVEDQLNRAKENESFFNRRIAALRKEYQELQDKEIESQKAEEAAKRENAFQELAKSYANVALNLDEINGMELEDDDKNEILSFMLDRDASGQTKFYKLFSDPNMAFKMAWYALKGEEAYNALTDYYQAEISKARRAAKAETKSATRTVRRSKTNQEPDPYGLNSYFKN